MSETTTDRLAEIEGQAAEYTPPEGWRVLQVGEVIQAGDRWVRPTDKQAFYALRIGEIVRDGTFIRRIEPDRIITPDDVAAEALAGVWDKAKAEQEIAELQAQVRFLKNRELTLGTRLQEEKAVTTKRLQQVEELRSEVSYVQGLLGEEKRRFAELETLASDLRAVNAATEKAVNSAARDKADLQHRLDVVSSEWAVQAGTIRGLQTQLEAVKAESAKRLETIQELRSEVSQVHRQWGDSRWRVEELEQKLAEAQPQPEASPVLQQVMIEAQAETIGRLNSEIHELNIDIAELETQLETVKAELVQQCETSRRLQIELDAAQQVPADSPELRQLRADLEQVTRERDEYRYAHDVLVKDANTVHERTKAMTVEAIAEWLEPIRLVDSPNLANETLQHLPQIMRSLVGLDTPEDVD